MNEYISVSEFAKLVQKSPQSIYKQLNNRLNPYVKLVDNQKMLNTRALTEIYGIEVEQPIQPELTTDSTTDSTQDNQLIVLLQQTQSILKKQLEEKDEQIQNLYLELQKEREHSRELTDKIADLARTAQQLHGISEGNAALQLMSSDKKRPWWRFWEKSPK